MTQHYFSERPRTRSHRRTVRFSFRGRAFLFETDRAVFSHGAVDRGTRLLLEALEIGPTDTVLDVGCGYGVIGIVAASAAPGGCAVLTDVNERAVALSRDNARRNGLANVEVLLGAGYEPVRGRRFDVIATNPPIRAGRGVVEGIIEGAPEHLKPGGRFYLVARTGMGAKTLGRIVARIFGNAEEVERGGGFRVYKAVRACSRPCRNGSAESSGS
ncbi:MAG: methyltransferase [Armatimonadota bacterium]|nr:methyltransferase [Armatimonadota bacterium]MDR5697950.1 methyltransferase [Armatimonadota bacterium]